jgi:hypothetical protein
MAVLPAAFVHGFSNFLGNFGPAILVFDALWSAAALLALRRLRAESPFASRDFARPGDALASIGASLRLDPANPHLHLRAAHFRLRAGDPSLAARHLDRYLAARPGDPYGLGLQGAARVLSGDRRQGEILLARAEALMPPRTRRLFRRNLERVLAPGTSARRFRRVDAAHVAPAVRPQPRAARPAAGSPAARRAGKTRALGIARPPPIDGDREDAELVAEQPFVAAGRPVPRTQVDAARAAPERRAVAQ